MGASVRIEDVAFGDPRFELLGQLLGSGRYDALGRMAFVWRWCTERGRHDCPAWVASMYVGQLDHVVTAELADWCACTEPSSHPADCRHLRVRGTEGRIEWLSERRATKVAGGRARAASARRDERGAFVSQQNDQQPASTPSSTRPSSEPAKPSAPVTVPVPVRKKASPAPPRRPAPPEAIRLAERIATHVLGRDPKAKGLQEPRRAATVAAWADSVRMLNERDRRDWPEIERVWAWASADPFWAANILSGGKLRDKFETLAQQLARGSGNAKASAVRAERDLWADGKRLVDSNGRGLT